MRPTPEAVRAALGALPLAIDTVDCTARALDVPSYPGGSRPHAVVRLDGAGHAGIGEHVGWTPAVHAAFGSALVRVPRGAWTLEEWSRALDGAFTDDYDRAAVEAAGIDLALRQAGTSLFGLLGVEPAPVRYVVSFGRVPDPVAEAQTHGDVELKVDVDPTWPDATFAALAAHARVAILDWKEAGTPEDHERAHRLLPDALVEDPAAGDWSPGLRARLAVDAPLRRAADLERLPTPPIAANLKAPRMGGPFEVLACAAACAARGIRFYVGGMFEVGPGRPQAQALAALLCPDEPNDVAPVGVGTNPPPRPLRLLVDGATPGFGGVRHG